MEEVGATIPKTHNLDDLCGLVSPHYPVIRGLRRGLIYLSDFAVASRYPGKNATKRQVESSLRWMNRVRDTVRPLLGLN